jgi:mannose-6-phosphate isomerase-like protein (cupin superfamily)
MINIQTTIHGNAVLANNEYGFRRITVEGAFGTDGTRETTIACISGQLTVEELPFFPGDTVHSSNIPLTFHGNGVILLAEKSDVLDLNECRLQRNGTHYKVVKPWGYELWLNGEHPCYRFKKIFIKAGNQTSLQYHDLKEETNFLIEGEADLIKQRDNSTSPIDAVTTDDLEAVALASPASIHITPRTIYRLRAKTDILLYEVSIPHLNDVIRLQDDTERASGRITSEHP